MAAWRGHRGADLDDRRRRVRRLDRHRVHRLPVPVQLRLPVDQHPGQGRAERGRHRRVLQRPQPRPDAAVARLAAAVRASACSSSCTSCSSAATASSHRSRRRPARRRARSRSAVQRHRTTPPTPEQPSADPHATGAAATDPRLARVPDAAATTWSRSSSSRCWWWRVLTVGLAAVFSSPDEKPITLRDWATAAPRRRRRDRGRRAGRHHDQRELRRRPTTARRRADARPAARCRSGPACRIPVDPAKDLVLTPLAGVSRRPRRWPPRWPGGAAANADQQHRLGQRLRRRPRRGPDGDPAKVASGDYGPVPVMAAASWRSPAAAASRAR